MHPPAGVVEKQVKSGIEPRSQVSIVFTGPFENDEMRRVAELNETNFGVDEPPMNYKGTMVRGEELRPAVPYVGDAPQGRLPAEGKSDENNASHTARTSTIA